MLTQADSYSGHEMQYKAGVGGFSRLGIHDSSPHWFCSCNGWRFDAKPNPRAATGNNRRAAERSHREHVTAAQVHDDRCEAEYVGEAPGWTDCGCADRQAATEDTP